MNPLAPVLTIDGPSGAGKGTISRIIASRMGWHYLDSGALYRAVGVAASWADIDTSDASALVRCTFDTHVQFVEQGEAMRVMVNGTDATDELRLETTGALASAIAAQLCNGLSLANACEAGIDYVARGLQKGYAPGRSEVLVLDHFGAAPHA